MTGLNPETLFDFLRVATATAGEISMLLKSGDDPRLANHLHPESSDEMEVALLPFQLFLDGKGVPHAESDRLTTAADRYNDEWKNLAQTAGLFLPTVDMTALAVAVKSASNAFIEALAFHVDAKKNKRIYNNLLDCLRSSAASVAKGIEARITKQSIQTDSLAEFRQYLASIKRNGKYPPLVKGNYANGIIGECDRNTGIVEIINVGFFHISPRNNGMWDVVQKLVETTDPRGYAHLGDRVWRNAFTSQKSAKVPTELAARGVKPASVFVKYIKPRGKDGFYRFEAD